jgi:hypothetical protein
MILERLDTIIAFVVILAGVSLLVTVFTQVVSAFLGLRGTNLRWGIETLLKELDPSLKAYAATITEHVLHHPLISDSTLSRMGFKLLGRWKLASAIRKEEFIEILQTLAQAAQDGKSQDSPGTEGVSAPRSAEPWRAALLKSFEQLNQKPAAELMLAASEIKKVLGEDSAKADQLIAQLMKSVGQFTGNIDRWFDAMMDRVSQRFVTQTRVWTIVFSVVVAFALHLDAQKLLVRLSADAEMRSRLIASADALSNRADEILVPSVEGAPTAYTQAMRSLIDAHKTELSTLGEPPGFADLSGAQKWLSTRLEAANIQDAEKYRQEYDALVPQAALLKAADNLQAMWKENLAFQLIPDPYPTPWYDYSTLGWSHVWGTLASAALLSLGAPFWFNALKTLSNLRPVLASREQKERDESDKIQAFSGTSTWERAAGTRRFRGG